MAETRASRPWLFDLDHVGGLTLLAGGGQDEEADAVDAEKLACRMIEEA